MLPPGSFSYLLHFSSPERRLETVTIKDLTYLQPCGIMRFSRRFSKLLCITNQIYFHLKCYVDHMGSGAKGQKTDPKELGGGLIESSLSQGFFLKLLLTVFSACIVWIILLFSGIPLMC